MNLSENKFDSEIQKKLFFNSLVAQITETLDIICKTHYTYNHGSFFIAKT